MEEKKIEKKSETFFKIDSAKSSFLDMIADRFITSLSITERVDEIRETFELAVRSHNDEAALELLQVLDRIYYALDSDQFHSWLKDFYWDLPDAKKAGTRYNEFSKKYDDVFEATLVEAKMHIIPRILSEWRLEELTESSIDAFRFIIAAFEPRPKEWRKREGGSVYETMTQGRRVYKEEKDRILQMIRTHVEWRQTEHLNQWIKQPAVPHEIQKVLIIARARNGGMELALEDIRHSEILQPLGTDKRSQAALELHKKICLKIAVLDAEVSRLIVAMKKIHNHTKTDVIGASETVMGDIIISYPDLDFSLVRIRVELEKDCDGALGCDIFDRARRHVEKWINTSDIASKSDISLGVFGGIDNIKLSWIFT